LLGDLLVDLRTTPLERDSLELAGAGLEPEDIGPLLEALQVDRSVAPVSALHLGGAREARRRLRRFCSGAIATYATASNDPALDATSTLSPYLHFGQISPLEVALKASAADAPDADKDAFLEQLIVRRELAMNYVAFTPGYDTFGALPEWARRTLEAHRHDRRPEQHDRRDLERAQTSDTYWNAAMEEMRETGYLHNRLRMYWGKKIIEYSPSPERAYAVALALNNRFFLDGRNPSSYANVGWLFGLHDQAWQERPVFGKVRYMSAAGLERKTDIAAYLEQVKERVRLAQQEAG
jgi:deoxyribodipyrimidine photo-lyase